MSTDQKLSVRCAIYTRKSSEEGLEQSFNSLHAQREACEAYILSQRQEGWRAVETLYDDGGFSGGSMERPALKRLLADIEAKKIDTVVVYKVDRLTRSLADFAKIVEAFDQRGISFVSVTQQFNTTSSMGRLTLNVLLSFAQFEREVTGERIRDKIAASKRKGMWTGGRVPLGYDLKDRRLIINPEEAERVREIYRLYLKFKCVAKLKAYLDKQGIKSKVRISNSGRTSGGASCSRGSLYELLRNRIYLGEIPHKGQSHPGDHQAILERPLWDKVQSRLNANTQTRKNRTNAAAPSLLTGLLYDHEGTRFTHSHAVKNGKRYRYYISQTKNSGGAAGATTRIPAQEIEDLVLAKLQSFFGDLQELSDKLALPSDDVAMTHALINRAQALFPKAKLCDVLRAVVGRIVVSRDMIQLQLYKQILRALLLGSPCATDMSPPANVDEENLLVLNIPARLKRCGIEVRLVIQDASLNGAPSKTAPALLKAISRAHEWVQQLIRRERNNQRAIAAHACIDER